MPTLALAHLPSPEQVLNEVFGYDAFRGPQQEIVEHVVAGGSALVLMPTGGGKSLCYQIPALCRVGIGVVLSPLIALMQDQVDGLRQAGVRAAALHSGCSAEESAATWSALRAGAIDLLYLSPERLLAGDTLERLAALPIALFAIDEAHCVSQWGHDFRPDYLQLAVLAQRFAEVPRVALTATADPRTREEIRTRLQLEQGRVFLASFDRPNIRYLLRDKDDARRQLLDLLADHRGEAGIVYARSRSRVDRFCRDLQAAGYDAVAYHAGLDAARRSAALERFRRESGVIVVATIAFGMGIDKPEECFDYGHTELWRPAAMRDPGCDHRMVIGYARVSKKQEEQGISLDGQVAQLERAGVDRIIAEKGSASRGQRPGWTELRLLVAQGRVKKVLMNDLSRLARDGSDMDFLEECAAAGTQVQDLSGQVWENQSIHGLASSGITSLMNRIQARMIGLKSADGIRRRREAGFLARGRLPFGYQVKNHQPAMDPEKWEQARWLFEQLLGNQMDLTWTIRSLPDDFPWLPTREGLLNWALNPMLRGGIAYGRRAIGDWERVEWGRAPRLVTTEEYESALRFYLSRRETNSRLRRAGEAHLLTSLLRCVTCGKNMGWKTKREPHHAARYQCKNRRCSYCGKTVREDLIREELARVLTKQAKKMADLAMSDEPVEIPPEEAKLREQLRQLEDLEAQGVPNLRKGVLALRDQIAVMRMDRIVDPWLAPDYQDLFSSPRAFLLTSDANLRPILLKFVKRVDYRFSSKAIKVVLR